MSECVVLFKSKYGYVCLRNGQTQKAGACTDEEVHGFLLANREHDTAVPQLVDLTM